MGLDQYAYAAQNPEDKERIEIAYWRKHPNLQGWMEKLYREKGGTEEFNAIYFEITSENLDRLEKDVQEKNLPATEGFFFGRNADNDYLYQDLKFIEDARLELSRGNKIFYLSSW